MSKKDELVEMIETTIIDYEEGSSDEHKDADFITNMLAVLKFALDYLKE